MCFGIIRDRVYLNASELGDVKIISTIKQKIIGSHGSDNWQIHYAIPINLLEKYCQKKFAGNDAMGNFYKCGDATDFKHYGVWNYIENPSPGFHLLQYFGKYCFQP